MKTLVSITDSSRPSRWLGLAMLVSLTLLEFAGPPSFASAARIGVLALLLWIAATFCSRQSKVRWLLIGLGLGLLLVGLLVNVLIFSQRPVVTQVPFSFH